MRRTIAIAFAILFAALGASAQVDNTRDRGFNAETAFHVGEFDSINALNGNLSISVPLGQTYKSNGTLEYRFTLAYNSHFWDYVMHSDDDYSPYRWLVPAIGPVTIRTAAEMARLSPFAPLTPNNQNREQVETNLSGVEAFPSVTLNAGLGWMVTLGELENGIVYIAPDGSRHEFFLNHHKVTRNGTGGVHAAELMYTRDSSYLRMINRGETNGVHRREVQFPDGIRKIFSCRSVGQNCTNSEESRWYLDSIHDPFGNSLTINRSTQPASGAWPWTYIETSNGVEVRRHTLHYEVLSRPGGRVEVRVNSAVLAATGGSATYTLRYDAGSIYRERGSGWHALHEDDHERARLNAAGKIDVSFLREVELPLSAGRWQFTYDHDTIDDTVSQGPEGTYWGISQHDGYLHSVSVPAGATATYEYESRVIPTGGCGPLPVGSDRRPVRAVSRRRLEVAGEVSEWRYLHYWPPPALNPSPCPIPKELITAIVDPYSTVTLNYFSVYRTDTADLDESPSPEGYVSKEYGLPFTRLGENATDSGGRLLSSEIYQCEARELRAGGALADNPSRLLPRYQNGLPAPACTRKQQRYVKYEYGSVDCSLGSLGNDCVASNPRIQSEATYRYDGPMSFTSVDYDDYDGLGHYRTEKTGGNLYSLTFGNVPRTDAPNAENDDVKTTTRRYNAGVDYDEDTDTLDITTQLRVESSTSPWILGTYPSESTSQWVIDPRTNRRVRQTFRKEHWFDGPTGRLKRTRTLGALTDGGGPATSDVIVDVVRTTNGARATVTENWFGGDGGGSPLGNLPDLVLTTPDYALRKVLYAGGVESTMYLDCNADYLLVHRDVIDQRTGLSLSTQDAAAAVTSYGYDVLGRLTSVTPPGETAMIYGYTPRSGSAGPIVRMSRDAGSLRDAAEWHYDPLGRLIAQLQWVPDQHNYGPTPVGFLNRKDITYDLLGRKATESAVRRATDAAPGLTRYTYDLFGRVVSQRYVRPNPNPDLMDEAVETETTYAYDGRWRVVETTAPLAPKVSFFDGLGRLIAVREQSRSGGGGAYTGYQYDATGQLLGVYDSGVDGGEVVPSNTRPPLSPDRGARRSKFEYDGRGFLLREYHPELDNDILYTRHDARGHAGVRGGGGPEIRFLHDPAERLRQVRGSDNTTLKRFRYAATGKLTESIRFNTVKEPLSDGTRCRFAVTETYEYLGVGKRLSKLTLGTTEPPAGTSTQPEYDRIVLPAPATCTTFRGFSSAVNYTYDTFGGVQTVTYPTGRVLTYNRWGHALKQIPGFVENVVYHPNGMLSRVRHTNNTKDVIALDPSGLPRVDTIQLSRDVAPRSVLWQHGPIAYDGAGNITRIGNLSARDEYDYDVVGRVTSARLSNPGQQVSVMRTQSFDRWGNIRNLNGRELAVNENRNRLTDALYDHSGNVLGLPSAPGSTGRTYSFEYDPFHTMTRMFSSSLGRVFLYNASDERVAILDYKKVPHRTTEVWSLRGPDQLIVSETERTGQGNANPVVDRSRQYVYADGRFVADIVRAAGASTDTIRHFHLDHLGSVRAMTDAAGNLSAGRIRTFLPFGEEVGSLLDAGRLAFTGHERDDDGTPGANGDFDYMHARYYSPAWGRFLSVDPVRNTTRSLPQRWNRYAYASNNPMRRVDPDGRADKESSFSKLGPVGLYAWLVTKSPLAKAEKTIMISIGGMFGVAGGLVGDAATAPVRLIPKADDIMTERFGPISENPAPLATFVLSVSTQAILDTWGISEARRESEAREQRELEEMEAMGREADANHIPALRQLDRDLAVLREQERQRLERVRQQLREERNQ